ncbi:MAG: nucleoside triphosphate pyrophosphohydrolase [Ktedonobacteraceae bacterium]|nr:nucleoside triphosphate pyrophosphohydrolase [Ktedonobacteraceae bacterium]
MMQKKPAAITLLGLGPGSIQDLTHEALTLMELAASNNSPVYFRTTIHPTVEPLKAALPALHIESFDRLYDESVDWKTLYSQIATEVCKLATQQPIIYAVPGHPLIGEASVQLILQMARAQNLSTTIVAGLSFLEPVCTTLELDPFEAGLQLIDATNLAALRADEIAGKVIPTAPLLVAQVYNRRLASEVKLALSECYPDEWNVKLIRAAGVEGEEAVLEIPLYELDRNTFANHLSTLYVPPLAEMTALRVPETLRYIIMRLRRDPDGCPWDRQQTHQSLLRYVIEETYEVVETLEENDMVKLSDELGDLLLQVYLHAEIARQDGDFALGDIYENINAKLIRRHPHVFGEVEVSNAGQVVQNWDAIKRQERAQAGKDVQKESVLDGVPPVLPTLMTSQEYQKRAIKKGFEFDDVQGAYEKLAEELLELQQADSPENQLEEMGDLLFVVAHIAQWLKIDADEALRRSNRKFKARFQAMEEMTRDEGMDMNTYNREEWIKRWNRAKEQTK